MGQQRDPCHHLLQIRLANMINDICGGYPSPLVTMSSMYDIFLRHLTIIKTNDSFQSTSFRSKISNDETKVGRQWR